MTTFQKLIKYLAMAFAIFLTVSIIGGILSMFGLFGGFFDGDAVTEDIKVYSVSSKIQSLEVKINAADFTIKQGESFSVESNLKHLTVEDKNGVLTVKETKKFAHTYTGAVLTLYVPADTVFEKANIITGAGRLTVDSLSASTMNFEFGAGEVTIDTLVATSGIDIDGGAGKITISGGALHNLDLDMGVGQLNLTAALTGKSDFDLGVGESNVTVIGNQDDYKLDIEKGIGNITVDGESIANIKGQGSGQNKIEISGGIGAVNLKFKES
ncbi:MAG: DUF4097 family beta strand repeat protein [Clostridia bacterium]|nr:DUF4097 family beta strand repeat protein [Clostridia bacterium]